MVELSNLSYNGKCQANLAIVNTLTVIMNGTEKIVGVFLICPKLKNSLIKSISGELRTKKILFIQVD